MLKKLLSKWVKVAAQMDGGRHLWTTLYVEINESDKLNDSFVVYWIKFPLSVSIVYAK